MGEIVLKGWIKKKKTCHFNIDLSEKNFFILIYTITGDEKAELYIQDDEWEGAVLYNTFDPLSDFCPRFIFNSRNLN